MAHLYIIYVITGLPRGNLAAIGVKGFIPCGRDAEGFHMAGMGIGKIAMEHGVGDPGEFGRIVPVVRCDHKGVAGVRLVRAVAAVAFQNINLIARLDARLEHIVGERQKAGQVPGAFGAIKRHSK